MSLPDWGITKLRAKIDTGARSSAIHVANLHEVGEKYVVFDVILNKKKGISVPNIRAKIVRHSLVKSSNGHSLHRYFVQTKLRIGNIEKQIEISLVNRDNMSVRMLIGRTALGSDCMVDASQIYLTLVNS